MKLSQFIPSSFKALEVWSQSLRGAFSESKGVQMLSGVLVLQLAIAVGLLWRSQSQADFAPAVQLVNVDTTTINEIFIDDGETSLTMIKVDDQWRLDDEHQTPASGDKIIQLLSDMAELKLGLPVANTKGSHQQLEVTDSAFQRRVTLKAGDEAIADLYMGTSPGFRKSHVRLLDQNQVYAVRLNTFDMPAKPDDWLDKNLLSFENVDGIQSGAIELALADEQWTIVKPPTQNETHEVDQIGIDSLVRRLSSLRVNGFAVPIEEDEPTDATTESGESESSETEELLRHSITIVQNDSPVTVVLSKKGSDVTIERSDVSGLFALPIATYEELTVEVIENLVVEKSTDDPADTEPPQG